MTDFSMDEIEEDFATLYIHPSEDDFVEITMGGGRGESSIKLALYASEARELIRQLTPLAQTPDIG